MTAVQLTFETAHALDAPFDNIDAWYDELVVGLCTACTGDAWAGRITWWHDNGERLCPDRNKRTPGFSPDPE